jgi:chemotaxis signal transduction protein
LTDCVLDIVSVDSKEVQRLPQVVQASPSALLSGQVTIAGTMIALVDMTNLLWLNEYHP